MSVQKPGKLLARELTTLIGVEDLSCAILGERLLYGFSTEVRRQRIG